MEQAMHAARLVAAQSALLALLTEQQDETPELQITGVTVTFEREFVGSSLGVTYTNEAGHPVAGEGV